MPSLVLASSSPRRRELLALLRVPFRVVVPKGAEQLRCDLPPEAQVSAFAQAKAKSVIPQCASSLVLGGDTLVAVGNTVLGKPTDRAMARVMLERLRGQEHRVCTAIAILQVGDMVEEVVVDTARVWMTAFSHAELEAYLDSGDWQGKAGAYSIQGQGSRLIERIEGDYTTVVGLPLRLTARLLATHGVSVPVDVDQLYRTKPYPNWERFQH